MSYALTYGSPYFSGVGSTREVPFKYPVALDGTGYFLDEQALSELEARSTVPVLRTQADQSNVPGLASLNPEDLWRRDAESWHHGAGQISLDRENSDPARFHTSKGIDCWTKWQLSLLPATAQQRSSVNVNVRCVVAGSRLYVADGATLVFYTALGGAATTVTGTPGQTITSIATDGFKVYIACGTSGVYVTNTGSSAATQLVTTAISGTTGVVGVVKGRLMVGSDTALYNVTDLAGPAALPAALYTHPNTGWVWTSFAEGPAALYAAGYAGDKSAVYRCTVKPDGTALDVPVVAGELPDGEVARAVQGYVGFLMVGTDRGVRVSALDGAGNAQFGALITTASATTVQPVLCFEPQDRFVWFGWSNYDTVSTGLGRLDLSTFPAEPLVPGYASDLMVTGQGQVRSVVTFGGYRVLAISGLGVYYESATDKVTTGSLDTGTVSYGLADDKIAVFVDVRHSALPVGSTYAASLSVDGGAFGVLGTRTPTSGMGTFNANSARGERFEVRLTLTGSGTVTPVVTRWTLRAFPSINRGEQFLVPIILAEEHTPLAGGSVVYIKNLTEARQALFALALAPRVVTFQEGFDSWSVLVKDVSWKPDKLGKTGWIGTATLRLLTVTS